MPIKSPAATPAEYQAKDDAFFDLVLRLRVVIREVADWRFSDGNSGHMLKRHRDSGYLIADDKVFPGKLSGYRPSTKTCVQYGAPKDRSRPLRGTALDLALGLNVFCCLEKSARTPLFHKEVKQILGNAAPAAMIPHVISDELGFPAIYRVYHATSGDAAHSVEQVRSRLDELRQNPALARWLQGREYGVAILAPTTKKRDALRRELHDSQLDQQAAVLLGLGPTAATLHSVLVELRKDKT
jgi:hypothetical protein